ncbi:MAG: glycosyltransferase family 39 protein [Thermoguttaceae bacterium]|jgi:4-amino-4-deoxy-L-arabinose transferase-like glycosyltransferase
MTQNTRYQLWILVAAAIIFFTCLGAASLWDEDETLYASISREMLQRGDWVVPMFNGHLFPEKPPLMFWLMIAGFEIFGQSEFAARFFSAVLGVGTALVTYHLGRLLFNPRVGLWAGLITASSIIFTVSARAATVDSALVFVSTSALLCFVAIFRIHGSGFRVQDSTDGKQLAVDNGHRETASGNHPSSFILHPLSFISHPSSLIPHLLTYGLFVLFYACLGMAILAKGPVGFLLPMASLGLFLMIVNSRRETNTLITAPVAACWKAKCLSIFYTFRPVNFLKSLWQLRPITGAIVILCVASPWYIMVGQRTDGLWLQQFFAKFNLRPFMQPILGHSGPFWLHIPYLLIGFFPWSVFLGPMIIETMRRIRDRNSRQYAYVLLTCWFSVFFIFWSICSTKLPHYILPVYPALALLTGCFLETWITEPARVGPGWMKNAWITTIAAGLGMMAAVGIVARIFLPGEELIGLVGLILIAGGYLCLYYTRRRHRERVVTVFAATAVIFLTAVFGFAAQRVDRHQNAKRLLALIRVDSPKPPPVCAYRFFRQSMVYYAGHAVHFCDDPEQLRQFLEQTPQAYVITLDKYQAEVEGKLPGRFRVLARERRFMAADEMVVFAPTGKSDSSRTASRPQISSE